MMLILLITNFYMCRKCSKFLQVSKMLEIFISVGNAQNFYKCRKSVKFLEVSENVCNRKMCATEGKYLLLPIITCLSLRDTWHFTLFILSQLNFNI